MENKKVKVFAPGTVANMGCGFDVMGMALDGVGDVLEVSFPKGMVWRYVMRAELNYLPI